MGLKLTIDGVEVPATKSWAVTYTPDPPPAPVPQPVTDIAGAIAAAKSGDTIYVGGHYFGVKSIDVKTPGLTIKPIAPTYIEFDPQGQKDAALFVLNGITGFTVSELVVMGAAKADAATYIVRCENASSVKLSRLKTVATAAGGMGIVFVRGCNGLDVDACSTEKTTVYSMYTSAPGGALINQNINVRRCVWGQSASHNMRCYGVRNMLIDECMFNNPKNATGRQCLKLMNGENVTIKRCDFDGTTRFGRDKNDPDTYSLQAMTIEDCNFTDWTRVDPTGGNPVTYRRCKVRSDNSGFVFHLFDRAIFEDVQAEYLGSNGQLFNNAKLASLKNVTFGGKTQ